MLSELLISHIVQLRTRTSMPLHRELYEALRGALRDGSLQAGERLPSSRELAQDLQLSRNTVVAAIEQLGVEGYLESRVGSGTYVKDGVQKAPRRRPRLPGHGPEGAPDRGRRARPGAGPAG